MTEFERDHSNSAQSWSGSKLITRSPKLIFAPRLSASSSQRSAAMLCFTNSLRFHGKRARSSAVNLADGATSRPFDGLNFAALADSGVFFTDTRHNRPHGGCVVPVNHHPVRCQKCLLCATLPVWLLCPFVPADLSTNPQLLTGLRGAPEALFKVKT